MSLKSTLGTVVRRMTGGGHYQAQINGLLHHIKNSDRHTSELFEQTVKNLNHRLEALEKERNKLLSERFNSAPLKALDLCDNYFKSRSHLLEQLNCANQVFTKGKNVLELESSVGRSYQFMVKNSCSYVGMDSSRLNVSFVKENLLHKGIDVELMSSQAILNRKGWADILLYLPDKVSWSIIETSNMIHTASKLLSRNGTVVIGSPEPLLETNCESWSLEKELCNASFVSSSFCLSELSLDTMKYYCFTALKDSQ